MLQDRFRKKTNRPTGGGETSLETTDISKDVPEIDDILAEVDKALEKAELIQRQVQPRGCGCG